ncbi:MAG: FliA/WhiG family RNA polymerase sigma factor [Kyrpidia sp.]|nr:FliA/WhiG family RNA polymerase sigma factor [Kyrpidia sp.]
MEKQDRPYPFDVAAYLPMVEHMARRMKSRIKPVPLEDLVSFGTLGLLEAARRYDPNLKTPFEAFAKPRIRGAMIDGVRTEGRVSRRQWERVKKLQDTYDRLAAEGRPADDEELCRELGLDRETFLEWLKDVERFRMVSLDDIMYTQDGEMFRVSDTVPDAVGDNPERFLSRREVRRMLADAVRRLPEKEQWVLSLHYDDGLSFKEVAEVLGVTPARVSQLHTKALLRLRSCLAGFREDLME